MPVKTKASGKRKAPEPESSEPESEESSSEDSSVSSGLVPCASKRYYQTIWKSFRRYLRKHHGFKKHSKAKPKENHYVAYMKHMAQVKKLKASTLWTYFSAIMKCHQARFAEDPKTKYPRLVQRLKILSKDFLPKQAAAFTNEEISKFIEKVSGDEEASVALVQDACLVSICFFSGMRCAELRELSIGNFTVCVDGLSVEFQGRKCVAANGKRSFLIPKSEAAFISVVNRHFLNLSRSGFEQGPVARKANTNTESFCNAVMGKNKLYELPQRVALSLGLHDGRRFSGHSLRRSAAQAAADAGASTFAMRRHFGWSGEAMPQRYVDDSLARRSNMASLLAPSNAPSPSQSHPQQVMRIALDVNINLSQQTATLQQAPAQLQ